MKKVGKTARPFRYDLNQFPYDCTVEVRNRFQGLDLIDRVPDELWSDVHDIVQETGIKTIPKKKKFKKIEIIPSIFSDHNALRLELNYRRKTIKNSNIWRL